MRSVAAADASTARILDGHLNGVERLVARRRRASFANASWMRSATGACCSACGGQTRRPARARPPNSCRRARRARGSAGSRPSARAPAVCSAPSSSPPTTTAPAPPRLPRHRRGGRRSTAAGIAPRACAHPRATASSSTTRRCSRCSASPESSRAEPWFSRDAVRTAATWAGLADCIVRSTLELRDPERAERRRRPTASGGCWSRTRRSSAGSSHAARLSLVRARSPPSAARIPVGSPRSAASRSATPAREIAVARGDDLRLACARRRRRAGARAPGPRPVPAPAPPRPEDHRARRERSGKRRRMSAEAGPAGALRSASTSAAPIPGSMSSSAYEREKYARTLAALPDAPDRRGAGGRLLDRCLHRAARGALRARGGDRLLRASAGARAAKARRTVANVELRRASFPEQAPPGPWELIVCSEVLYYLRRAALERAIGWLADAAAATGRSCSRSAGAERARTSRSSAMTCTTGSLASSRAWHSLDGQARGLPPRPLRRPMSAAPIVIVGAGPAGLSTARSYRESGGRRRSRSSAASRGPPIAARR